MNDAPPTAPRALDQELPMPLFHQLAARLRDDIFKGVYRPHDQLPSEPMLCRLYQVSRATVRMALDKLVEQRLVYRRHGKGTFVSPPEPQFALLTHPSIAHEMRIRGIEPTVRHLRAGRKRLPAAIAPFIAGQDGHAYFIERLILGDGQPFGIARMYLHPELALTSKESASDMLIFDVLVETTGVRIVDASYLYLEPVYLEGRDAGLLGVSPGTAGLDVARLLTDQSGRAVMHARTLFRGDRCRLLFSSRNAPSPDGRVRDAAGTAK